MKRRTPKPAALAATHDFQAPKSPRQWAAEIAELPTREDRVTALETVPVEWRGIVRTHVEMMFARKRSA
jgi:hypothetical protein